MSHGRGDRGGPSQFESMGWLTLTAGVSNRVGFTFEVSGIQMPRIERRTEEPGNRKARRAVAKLRRRARVEAFRG